MYFLVDMRLYFRSSLTWKAKNAWYCKCVESTNAVNAIHICCQANGPLLLERSLGREMMPILARPDPKRQLSRSLSLSFPRISTEGGKRETEVVVSAISGRAGSLAFSSSCLQYTPGKLRNHPSFPLSFPGRAIRFAHNGGC